jgi:hypothetical protein
MKNEHLISEALVTVFTSPNELDRNSEAANIVDGLFEIAMALREVARAIGVATQVNKADDERA